jgi:hypothetical protein
VPETTETEVRMAKTEALFRDVNERIAEASERFGSDEAEFMCECADPACAERLEVPLDEYEEVRADATTFVLDPDHVEPDIERVVERRDGYAVVKKFNATVTTWVRRLDPRAGTA